MTDLEATSAGKERAPRLSVKRINEMSIAYQQAGTLWAGLDLDLFTRISNGLNRLDDIARALDIDKEVSDRLCASCLALGLIEQTGGVYRNAPDVERYLVKGKPTYHGDWALYHKNGYEQWKNFAAALKPTKSAYERIRDNPQAAREIATAGYHSSISSSKKFVRMVDLSPYSRLLDIGGGSGIYCITACQTYPNLHAITMDFATVCAVADEFISKAGLTDRIRTFPGDYLTDEYPTGVDVILICGTLEARDTQEQKMVLKKAHATLPNGGLLVYITNMLDDDGSGPFEAVQSNLESVLGPKPWGRIQTASDTASFLREAGFSDLIFSDFAPGTYRMVTAKKVA